MLAFGDGDCTDCLTDTLDLMVCGGDNGSLGRVKVPTLRSLWSEDTFRDIAMLLCNTYVLTLDWVADPPASELGEKT